MNTNTPVLPRHHGLVARLGRLGYWLITPRVGGSDLAPLRTRQLLAIFLCILIALLLLIDVTSTLTGGGDQLPWYGYLLFGGAYLLNRTHHYALSLGLTISAFPLMTAAAIVTAPAQSLERTVYYLALSFVLAGIFCSRRGLAALAASSSAGLLLLPIVLQSTSVTYGTLLPLFAVNTIGAALACVCLWHRNRVEQDRQAQLRASEEQLRLALDAAHMGIWDADRPNDVTARKQAEAALRASEERYRVISELVSDFAFSFRFEPQSDTMLEWVTDAFTRITGYTLHDMQTLADWGRCIHPEDDAIASQHLDLLRAGQPTVGEYRIIAKDGQTLWLRFYSRPVWDAAEQRVIRVHGAVQDITQVKRLEHQLSQAQKLEAIGQLAGGIAHDFNNLLTVILGNTELVLAAADEIPSVRADIEGIRQAAVCATALTRRLLTFSRQQIMETRILDLTTVVHDMEPVLHSLIGGDIALVTRLAHDLGPLRADPGQIEQVILNLAVNARDAMPSGGRLLIETANVSLDDPQAQGHSGPEPRPYIMLRVSDTGSGMDSATRARIFEPFFTTKPIGKGTGLGLATVYGIVMQSGGQIVVESEPGRGTAFQVYFPRCAVAEAAGSDPPAVTDAPDRTILLVEDEATIRALAARVLQSHGYQVLEAADGPAALQVAGGYAGPIALLLTDVCMPGGLSGRDLADQICAQRPAMKVMYMSGYSEAALAPTHMTSGQAFLQKPFTPDALTRKVAELMQRPL